MVIATHDLRGSVPDPDAVLPRADVDVESAIAAAEPIVRAVRTGSTSTLLDLGHRFDGVRPPALRVPRDTIDRALAELDPAVRASLELAIRRVRAVHCDQRPDDRTTRLAAGGVVTSRWQPVDRVGLYVPGGQAVYPSSVVMNVVPAQEAGVGSLAIASPPQRDHAGFPHPTTLAAAALLGVDEVYAVGGAQAIAMLAYGVADDDGTLACRPVDIVTGPGNVWVTAAKRLVRGQVAVDAEAGPTEILIVADDTGDPDWIAADLISQAEHDVLAASVLVTTSATLAEAVARVLERRTAEAKHSERIREALSGPQSGILIVDDLDTATMLSNAYGAEHLEVHTRDAQAVARRITSAGAIFVGGHSPVSLGDYCAGSNHVLPTGGGARHTGGLSVQTFLRCGYLVEYDEPALDAVADSIVALAQAEDLPAHGDAVTARFSPATTSDDPLTTG